MLHTDTASTIYETCRKNEHVKTFARVISILPMGVFSFANKRIVSEVKKALTKLLIN